MASSSTHRGTRPHSRGFCPSSVPVMTNKRLVDLVFGEDEKLWRRIERKQVTRDKRVKASALRLQISVVREKYGAQATVTEGKFNGIAEITASRAAQV